MKVTHTGDLHRTCAQARTPHAAGTLPVEDLVPPGSERLHRRSRDWDPGPWGAVGCGRLHTCVGDLRLADLSAGTQKQKEEWKEEARSRHRRRAVQEVGRTVHAISTTRPGTRPHTWDWRTPTRLAPARERGRKPWHRFRVSRTHCRRLRVGNSSPER